MLLCSAMKLVGIVALAATAALAAACSSNHNSDTGADAGSGSGSGYPEAMPPAGLIPQVINSGGTVFGTPVVYPIFFAGSAAGNDTMTEPYVEAFLPMLATSDYWKSVGMEYGVGALTIMPSIVSMDAVPTSDQALRGYLDTQLDGNHAGWPAADVKTTIYMVVLPAGQSYQGACTSFDGYHDENPVPGASGYTYAIIANCGASGATSALDEVTVTISHELIEAATDPKVNSYPAYLSTDTEHRAWAQEAGAEVGDMCEWSTESGQRLVGNYMVQRIWSNKAALEGHDGCQPALSTPYVNAWPSIGDVTITGSTAMTEGLTIAQGASANLTLTMFSDAPTDPWQISVLDADTVFADAPSSFSVFYGPVTSGSNGTQVALSITRDKPVSSNGNLLFVENLVGSDQSDLQVPTYWWIYVQ